MTNTPADWTDAEMARWMAERDGWQVNMQREYGSGVIYHARNLRTGEQYKVKTETTAWRIILQNIDYPLSLDAAVAWLGRRGLEWRRWRRLDQICVGVASDEKWFHCFESPTCPTARALCNAGVAAVQAMEASNG